MEIPLQSFISRQVSQIREGGPNEALLRFGWLIDATFAVLFVLAVRALRPVITIRVGSLPGQFIGNLAPIPEIYLCERDAGKHGRRVLDIFFFYKDGRGICNQQLKKMWEREILVVPFSGVMDKALRRLPLQHHVPWRMDGPELDIYGLLPGTEPHVSFTESEEMKGRQALLDLGVAEDSDFICFHARDEAFTNSTQPDWNRYESSYRNCKASNYVAAGQALASRGHFAIRMGSLIDRPIPDGGAGVIDYATIGTNDFMDIYLSAKCRFFIGCTSGLFTIAQIFRKPLVLTNYARLSEIVWYGPDTLIIPKKLWSRTEQRYLAFGEIAGTNIGNFLHKELFDELGIELIENTPEEISAVCIEMDDRLKGVWQTTEEDEVLQTKFWSNFQEVRQGHKTEARIGAEFLRNNAGLV